MLDIHVVSHTHWDREWYLTYEQFRFRLVALIDRLLDLLDDAPAYKHFHLDGQTIVLEDYLEIRPEQEPRLRRAIEAGRILIGPWYVMPDEFLVSGESLVRNLSRGHRISREFGTPMPVGYLPDLFGHVGQMPQIWRQFGLDNTILWRGFGGRQAEYWWQAPDGSRVLMMHLPPEGYCNATRIVFDPEAMMARATKAVEYERGRTAVGQALLMNGVDHVEPQRQIPDLVEKLSAIPGQRARHSTLPDYVAAVRRAIEACHPVLETVTGELRGGEDYANLLPGVLSARVYLKQQNAHVQTLLESYAEPLAVCAALLESPYPAGELRHAWKTLVQNHPHDSICGCSIDAVHDENMTRFSRARQVAEAVIESALHVIGDAVEPAEAGSLRVLAVNTDAVECARVVEAFIDLPYDTAEPWRTIDPQVLDRPVTFWPRDRRIAGVTAAGGRAMPFQVLGEEDVIAHEMSRFDTPWALHVRRVHLVWWAAVPSCGYSAFDLFVCDGTGTGTDAGTGTGTAKAVPYGSGTGVSATDRSAENEFLRLAINDDGTLDVDDKTTGAVFRGVGLLEDTGDVGDEYNYCPPAIDRRVTNADAQVIGITRVHAGPLRATFRVDLHLPLPAAAALDRQSRDNTVRAVPISVDVTLEAGASRVAFTVSVENTARDHRLRMLFPTGARRVESVRADTAFDVVTRPARRDVPATIRNETPVSSAPMLSVVDAGDAQTGATVITTGLTEYEVVPSPDQMAIAVTLIRAVGDLSRNDLATRPSGHAGPPVATPAAQCLGRYRFDVAFEPRGAAPEPGQLLASARAVAIPPRVVAARTPGGNAPVERSFLRIDRRSGDVTLSALKKADDRDTVIVRLFNPGDRDGEVALKPDFKVAQAFAVNCLEAREHTLEVTDDGVLVRLKPHQIQTIELAR
jgi:alpha-mannosidase